MREPETRNARLREVIGLFLKLGATAFGGPVVHIALMRDEVVRRRRWIDPLTVVIALATGLALVRFKVNATWLVLAGGVVGLVRMGVG